MFILDNLKKQRSSDKSTAGGNGKSSLSKSLNCQKMF